MGARVSVDSLQKENSWRKSFLIADNVEWTEVIKICEKWCLLNDVKTSIYKAARNKRFDGSYYKFLYKNYLQNLKLNVNSGFIFHFILVGILSILILSVKNIGQGWGGFCLMEKIC